MFGLSHQKQSLCRRDHCAQNTEHGLFECAATPLARRIVTTHPIRAEIAFIKLDDSCKFRFVSLLFGGNRNAKLAIVAVNRLAV